MKALLDTNIVLDVLLAREPFASDSAAVWRACDEGKLEGYISALSIPNVFYIVRRTAGLPKAHDSVAVCLQAFRICPIDRVTLEEAARFPGNDFEDNVQIACATIGQIDVLVTRDLEIVGTGTVRVANPSQTLSLL